MVSLGVAEKQRDKARQVLERPAEQAGLSTLDAALRPISKVDDIAAFTADASRRDVAREVLTKYVFEVS